MKNLFKFLFILVFFLISKNLKADTLFISLQEAYTNNPKLNAERANVRATYQEKNLAISEFMPSITISGYASEQDNTGDYIADSNFYPSEQSLLIEQKIFDGFGGVANYKKQKYEYYSHLHQVSIISLVVVSIILGLGYANLINGMNSLLVSAIIIVGLMIYAVYY